MAGYRFLLQAERGREDREAGEGKSRSGKGGRGLPPSPLNDVCRLSNARVNWNTCDCLKCCNPRLAHPFLFPFPLIPTLDYTSPCLTLYTPPSQPPCSCAGMQISMYVNRMLLAAHLLSLLPRLRLWRRLICIQELYIHMLNGPRSPLHLSPPLSRQLNPFCAH